MTHENKNMLDVKRTNRRAVLRLLQKQGAMSRKQLAKQLELTPAAITKIVGEMIEEGLLAEGAKLPGSSAGRREILVYSNYKAYCALGIFLELNHAILSAVWLDGRVIMSEKVALDKTNTADEIIDGLSQRLLDLVEQYDIEKEKVLGLGVAIRGVISTDGQISYNSFGIFRERNYPITRRLEEKTGFPVHLANNVRAMFLAQIFSEKDRDLDAQFFLRCEYGIGASLVFNGKIWYGSTGQCSEMGHIPVIRRGGKSCNCGKSGCLETIASPLAIQQDAIHILSEENTPILWRICSRKTVEQLEIDDVLDAARNGDEKVAQIVDNAVMTLSNALKNLIYIVDPRKIILYGRIFENRYYLSKLLAEMGEGVDINHEVIVEKSKYNLRLEEKSAGLVVIEHFLDQGALP